jgi:D-galactose 1-dehydrogenase
MQVPSNLQAPIAAQLEMRDTAGALVTAEFDFLQTGPQTWDIRVVTERGVLVLSKGGSELSIDGAIQPTEPEAEYRGLYDRFAALIEAGQSDVDIRPLQLVADAFLVGERQAVEPFIE